MLKESIMKRIASKVVLLVLLLLVLIAIGSSSRTQAQESDRPFSLPYGCILIEVPSGCNVPKETIDGLKESNFRGRVDERGTFWWGENYCLAGPPAYWWEIPGTKTMCSLTGETIIVTTD